MPRAPRSYIDERARGNPPERTYRNPGTAEARRNLHMYHGACMQRFRAAQFRARPNPPWHALRPSDRAIVNRLNGQRVPDDELPPEDDGDPVAHPAPPPPESSGSGWGQSASGSGWGQEDIGWGSWGGWTETRVTWEAPVDERVSPTSPPPVADNVASVPTATATPGDAVTAPADNVAGDAAPAPTATAPVSTTAAQSPQAEAAAAEAAAAEDELADDEPAERPPSPERPPRTTRIPGPTQRYETLYEFRDRLKAEYIEAQTKCAKKNKACRVHFPCRRCYALRGSRWYLAGETYIDEYVDDEDTDGGSVNGMTPPPDARCDAELRDQDNNSWYRRQEEEVGERFPMW
ncbi:hypothetical protein EXIGLDRAFT_700858 [Exidia glandulosa HHB12029]|uniref:Uncharacterized protein n=1 Tax=Exidia glandulosa HHB12029 TaxID=1314781 RepID=A0A165D921_EXIGL|nr:hypothetical protein EXIGLDRAFT_700858 [Exidia glandulosa HHB12029]